MAETREVRVIEKGQSAAEPLTVPPDWAPQAWLAACVGVGVTPAPTTWSAKPRAAIEIAPPRL